MALQATSAPPAATRPRRTRRAAEWGPGRAVVAVVAGLVAGLAAAFAAELAFEGDRAAVAAGMVVAPLVLLAVVVAFARADADAVGASTLGVRKVPLGPAIGWGAAVLVATFAIDGLLALLFGAPADASGSSEPSRPSVLVGVLLVAGVAVTTPIAEELAFRGYLFPALTRWRGPWVSAVVTSVLFGAAHALALPPAFLLGAAAFGFGACLLFWFTGSLLPCVAIHSLNNAIVLAVVTGGRLWWAVVLAPVVSVLLLLPVAGRRRPDAAVPQST